MLNWLSQFNIFCFLDNNNYSFDPSTFECIAAAGSKESIRLKRGEGLGKLQAFYDQKKEWMFGHFGYELLNESTPGHNINLHEVAFDDGFFFVPEILLKLFEDKIQIESTIIDPAIIFGNINLQPGSIAPGNSKAVNLKNAITQAEYTNTLLTLKKHLLRGDCYEINFCQSFYAENTGIHPLSVYNKLTAISPNPFAAFYRIGDKYCLCASPERFLKKTGDTLISQPIKGTSRRDHLDEGADRHNKEYLIKSEKEKTENVMIVDLVRNDLSKVCKEGTVKVKELFGIYSFPQVHQMISTIEGKVSPETGFTEIISACFPMGSMTGAPKKKVVELIEQYETGSRGLFSGSIGYITPENDFDFNVVIRSLMYDETKQLLSFKAGGGITFKSNIEEEYEESILKAEAIILALKQDASTAAD